MVSGSSASVGGTSGSSSDVVGPAAATARSQVSSAPVVALSSCLETRQQFARVAGFSSRVDGQLSCSRRKSFLAAYQSKWSLYRKWCWDKGHSSSNPSIPKIVQFLLWLCRSKGLSLSAVKAYRSMLSAVFGFKLPSLGEDLTLRGLIRSFAVERPRSHLSPPAWDLDVILKHMMSDSYEPLESQFLRTLTKKVLFLVALATAKHVGELQALSRFVPVSGRDLVLSYLLHFVAKTELPSHPVPRSFHLLALSDFAHGLEEGCLLCPVQALSIYLRKTKGLVQRSAALLYRLGVLLERYLRMLFLSSLGKLFLLLGLLGSLKASP